MHLIQLSDALSGISIACWSIIGIPQIVTHYKEKQAGGLSLAFLFLWLVGDVFSLVGAVFSHGILSTVIIAAFYTVMDVILIAQVLYYERCGNADESEALIGGYSDYEAKGASRPRNFTGASRVTSQSTMSRVSRMSAAARSVVSSSAGGFRPARGFTRPCDAGSRAGSFVSHGGSLRESMLHSPVGAGAGAGGASLSQSLPHNAASPYLTAADNNGNAPQRRVYALLFVAVASSLYTTLVLSNAYLGSSMVAPGSTPLGGRTLLSAATDNSDPGQCVGKLCTLGVDFGWISSALYILSRVPQLVKNFMRGSTEGVSLIFFGLAVLGNVTYAGSIFAWSSNKQFILDKAPWLLGSLGTLLMDMLICLQCVFMKTKTDPLDDNAERECVTVVPADSVSQTAVTVDWSA